MHHHPYTLTPLSTAQYVWSAVLATGFTLIVLASSVRADIISDWNAKALATMAAEKVTSGIPQARTLALMHIAMFDALNAVDRRYAPYGHGLPDAAGAAPEAAVHAAARQMLVTLYPKQKAALDEVFDMAIARMPESTARTAGLALGDKVAASIHAARQADGFNSPDTYRPATAPGVYVPTALPLLSHVASIKPLVLPSVSQFRPGPPPALDSALWARDYNETRDLGAVNSTTRTAWQTETARFWVVSGAQAWNEATRGLLASNPLPLLDSARLLAYGNMVLYDGYLAVFDAKYHYGFWRPITAIRNGDRDGNEATASDAAWKPLIDTPMHPEYPCAHCVADGAVGTVLKSVFGTGTVPTFTLTSTALPGVTRMYTSIQQLEEEVAMARIWGGVHYRTSNDVGNTVGKHVGDYVLQHVLRPLR